MDSEATRLVLALPVEARRVLAEKAEGPGYHLPVPKNRPLFPEISPHWGLWEPRTDAWLPCDPCEVLRVAAELLGGLDEAEPTLWYEAGYWRAEAGDGTEKPGDTALAAAVACFAKAWALHSKEPPPGRQATAGVVGETGGRYPGE